jgi:hypothetical protein
MNNSRRDFLARGLVLATLAVPGTAMAQAAICADPVSLPLSQKNRRRAVGYSEPSADAARQCGLCTFFTGGSIPGKASCGTCAMLGGGPVSTLGVCTSFTAKVA